MLYIYSSPSFHFVVFVGIEVVLSSRLIRLLQYITIIQDHYHRHHRPPFNVVPLFLRRSLYFKSRVFATKIE